MDYRLMISNRIIKNTAKFIKSKIHGLNSDPKFLTPKQLCRIKPDNDIQIVSGCRAGLANRIRSFIALKGLGFSNAKIIREPLVGSHDWGGSDLDDLFLNVNVYPNDEYDFVYRSHVIPSLFPSDINDNTIIKSNFNKLNHLGLLKPEVINSDVAMKKKFRNLFFDLGLKTFQKNLFLKKNELSIGIHIRHWETSDADGLRFRLTEDVTYASGLWVREQLTKEAASYLISRIESDIKKYNIKNVVVYSDSNETIEIFGNASFRDMITQPERTHNGWEQALNEIILLSRHKVIYAFPNSTFSHMSAFLSNDESIIRSVY